MPGLVMAQNGTVTGTVVDGQTGEALPGATVQIPNEGMGAATDSDGEFSFRVAPGNYELRVSFIGYQTRTRDISVSAGSTTRVRFQLQPSQAELEEVVVTALGFEQNRGEQGAAQTTISGADVAESAEVQLGQSLSAKAAGLNITSSGGDPGASSRIVIRGNRTIQGDNEPLFVVDGTPISTSSIGGGVDGVQQQSRLADINPQDIESVEVLKGPSAAALYGSRAQSGVILIETKKGDYQSDFNVNFSSTYGFSEANLAPDLQQKFGQGEGGRFVAESNGSAWGDPIEMREGGEDVEATAPGQFFAGPNSELDEGEDVYGGFSVGQESEERFYRIPSAGDLDADGNPIDPVHGGKRSQETFDHGDGVFQNGQTVETNLSMSGGGEEGRFYVGIGHTQNEGIIPANSDFERTSIRVNADRQFTDDFNLNASFNWVRNSSNRVQQGSNLSGLLLPAWRTPPGFDNEKDYLVNYRPQGEGGAVVENKQRAYTDYIGSGASPVFDNPYFVFNEIENTTLVNRLNGNLEANYDVTSEFRLTGRVGLDQYTDRRQSYFPVHNASNDNGSASESNLGEYEINVDLIGRYQQQLSDEVGLDVTVGANFRQEEFDDVGGSLESFSSPNRNLRSLSNAQAQDISASTNQSTQRLLGVYSDVRVDLYDQLFVEATGRVDQSSTFGPDAEDVFFYPSANVAWQFSDLLDDDSILSFGKLRVEAGIVGREPNPYQAFTYFDNFATFDGFLGAAFSPDASNYGGGFEKNSFAGNPLLEPEQTTSWEVGTDLRFFDDRFSLTASYYASETDNAIFFVDNAPSTGFSSRIANAATIQDNGIELDLEAEWPSVGDFQWTTGAQWWAVTDNTVTDLSGVDQVTLNGFVGTASSVVEGEDFGVLYGDTWRRAPDGCEETTPSQICEPLTQEEMQAGFTKTADGQILDPDGFPVVATQQAAISSPQPDWRMNIDNTISYKGFSFYTLFDFKIGGDVWNGTRGALFDYGTHGDQDWQTTIDPSEFDEVPVNFNGQTPSEAVASGFWPEYRENDDGTYTFRGQIKDFGAGPVILDESYYNGGNGSGFVGASDQFIEDGSYVKLREVSLSYTWDHGVVERSGLSAVRFTATAANVLTFTDYSGIDPETNLTGDDNAQGLDYFNNPNNRSYQFRINIQY